MPTIAPTDLIGLWERGASRHPVDRSALLYACARPALPVDAIADVCIGEINTRLLELRAMWFGDEIHAHVDCKHCGERLGLTLAVRDLVGHAGNTTPDEITAAGVRCRPPSLGDLAAIASEPDPERAAERLLARCLLDESGTIALSDARVRELEDALEAVDPGADLAFEVRCEACGDCGTAQLDPGELLWDEITARARGLLVDVHQLASAYGWSEREILALTPERRASYLWMVAR
jgi:hypothetical protein